MGRHLGDARRVSVLDAVGGGASRPAARKVRIQSKISKMDPRFFP
jgi:hypothetical protein